MKKLITFDEILKNGVDEEVVDLNNPSCSQCNECCTMFALITKEEYLSLRKFLRTDKEGKRLYKDARKRFDKNYTRYDRGVDTLCPFTTTNKKCAIYDKRPSICKKFHCKKELAVDFDKNEYIKDGVFMIINLFIKDMEGEI